MKRLSGFLADKLVANSLLLIIDAGFMAGVGFLFWKIVTYFLDPAEVGIASTVLSAVAFLANLSLLGFDMAIIRHLAKADDRRELTRSLLSATTIAAIIAGGLFLVLTDVVAPKLAFLLDHAWLAAAFIMIVVFNTAFLFIDAILISKGNIFHKLFKTSVFNLTKVGTVFLLFSMGAGGILIGYGSSVALAVVFSVAMLWRTHGTDSITLGFPKVSVIKEYAGLSFANFFSRVVSNLPSVALPLIVLYHLTPSDAAFLNISVMLSSIIANVSSGISASLFSSGSGDDNHSPYIKKTILLTYALLLTAIAFLVLFARPILGFFGAEYSENALDLFRLLCISQLGFAVESIIFIVMNLKKDGKGIISMTALVALITIMSSLFVKDLGIAWVGVSYIIAYVVAILVFGNRLLEHMDNA